MTTTDRLAEIEARLANATPGPWEARHHDTLDWLSQSPFIASDGHEPGSNIRPEGATDPIWASTWPNRSARSDAALIANAPADLAALVAVVREVEAIREWLRQLQFMRVDVGSAEVARRLDAALLGEDS